MDKTFDSLKAFEAAQAEKFAADMDKPNGDGAWARSLAVRQSYRAWIEAELPRVKVEDLQIVSAMIMGELMLNHMGRLVDENADPNEALQALVYRATRFVADRLERGGPDLMKGPAPA